MSKLLKILIGFAFIAPWGLAGADDDGVATGDASVDAVTVIVPSTIARGNVLPFSVNYNPIDPTRVTCVVILPTNDPSTYPNDIKIYTRNANLESVGVVCDMWIPAFIQYEGLGIAFALVPGQMGGIGFFNVTP